MTAELAELVDSLRFGATDTPIPERVRQALQTASPETIRGYLALFVEAVSESLHPSIEDAKTLQAGGVVPVGRSDISLETLAKFIEAVLVSSHELDELTYFPPEARKRAIQQRAAAIGCSTEFLLNVDRWWHSKRLSEAAI